MTQAAHWPSLRAPAWMALMSHSIRNETASITTATRRLLCLWQPFCFSKLFQANLDEKKQSKGNGIGRKVAPH